MAGRIAFWLKCLARVPQTFFCSASSHAVTEDAGSSEILMPVAQRPGTRTRLWRSFRQHLLAPSPPSGTSLPALRLPSMVASSSASLRSHGAQVLVHAAAPVVVFGVVCELIVVAALVSGVAVDYFVENVAATRCEGSGEGVSDCCRAVVPVGWVVIGSEWEVPPHQPSPLRGGGCSETHFVQSL